MAETQKLIGGGESYGSLKSHSPGPTNPETGLTETEAERRMQEYGPNELAAATQDGFFKILFAQMGNLIFLLTAAAALICYLTGDEVKSSFLIGLVCIVCFCNAVGEYSGQDPAAALRLMGKESCSAVRDGQVRSVDVKDLVPGDIVHLGIGDMVPADMRVLECNDLQTNEAILTGEPKEVVKGTEPAPPESDTAFPPNMCYKSTDVVGGSAVCEVTATGMSTQVGLIAKRLSPEESTPLNPLQRSINVLGTIIGAVCGCVITFGFFASFFMRYQGLPPKCHGDDRVCILYDSMVRGLLMAVAIIPHGLPLVVMVMLRVGSSLMAKRNAVVTRQSAVDYLGATHVICTDKTGTLTEGKMAAKLLVGVCRDQKSKEEGRRTEIAFYPLRGLNPNGGVFLSSELSEERCKALDDGTPAKSVQGLRRLTDPDKEPQDAAELLARAAAAAACLGCYGTKIVKDHQSGAWIAQGNMSEAALRVAAYKGGYPEDSFACRELRNNNPRDSVMEVLFSPKRKMSATVHQLPSNRRCATLLFGKDHTHFVILKGAPDRIMGNLSAVLSVSGDALSIVKGIAAEEKRVIESQNEALAHQALRSLLMAVRPLTASEAQAMKSAKGAEERMKMILGDGPLAFLGLWGIFDPPRTSVPPSIKMCHEAGVRVVMITGDQRPTALAIGKLVGIVGEDVNEKTAARRCADLHEDPMFRQTSPETELKRHRTWTRTMSVHDDDFKKSEEKIYKDDSELRKMTSETAIWSRAQPTDKVAIVESLVRQGKVSAMTGDGVNDAPALKKADIGVAMGVSGTAVTKNAADMILMDDNFSTIVAAVKEGRKIYGNVQKYVVFNLSVKGSECACLIAAILIGLPMPIQGLQQLVNMVCTHIVPPMALAWEDAEEYTMRIPPRETKTDLVVNKIHMLFRWLPFVVCYAIIVMFNMCFAVWMHTGFVRVDSIIGSSVMGAVPEGKAACAFAGFLDIDGHFVQDLEPFHCTCYVRDSILIREPLTVDQWGRTDSADFKVDLYSGASGDFFLRDNTPWANVGRNSLVQSCRDNYDVERICWKDGIEDFPVLPPDTNCAAYGAKLGQSMGYVMIHLGEVLSLATFRTDGFFGNARFSRAYTAVLVFNLICLAVILHVPVINHELGLAPLTTYRFLMACIAPVLLVFVSELTKIAYRHQLATQHAIVCSKSDVIKEA